jgi:hypothetical protein
MAKFLFLAAFAFTLFASTPIATVTSTQPFVLDGHPMSSAGVTSWPLIVGDDVASVKSPLVLFFRDGSSVRLAADSRTKLMGTESEPKLILMSGTLDYKLVAGTKLSVTSLALEQKQKEAEVKTATPPNIVHSPRPNEVTLASASTAVAGSNAANTTVVEVDSKRDDSVVDTASSNSNADANTPVTPTSPSSSGSSPAPNRRTLAGTLSSPKFLVPAAGAAAAGVTAGLLRLPPVSRHF